MANIGLTIPYDKLADYCQQNQIEYLAVFGSTVRDELRPDSDVDLLVEFTPEASRIYGRLRAAHPEVEWTDIVGFRNIAVHAYFSVAIKRQLQNRRAALAR